MITGVEVTLKGWTPNRCSAVTSRGAATSFWSSIEKVLFLTGGRWQRQPVWPIELPTVSASTASCQSNSPQYLTGRTIGVVGLHLVLEARDQSFRGDSGGSECNAISSQKGRLGIEGQAVARCFLAKILSPECSLALQILHPLRRRNGYCAQ